MNLNMFIQGACAVHGELWSTYFNSSKMHSMGLILRSFLGVGVVTDLVFDWSGLAGPQPLVAPRSVALVWPLLLLLLRSV